MGLARALRVALASRKLFRNWLGAGVRYLLYKRGLLRADQIVVICRDGSKDALPAKAYGLLINWYADGVATGYSCKNHDEGIELPAEEIDLATLVSIKLGWRYEHGYWIKNGVKFRRMRWLILEVFEFGEYDSVDVAGKIVVDVGAYVGDSAIYFATRGAKRVIAIEPHHEAYREMLENIKLNGLEDKIIPINAGLASKQGKICLEDVDMDLTGGTYHRPGDCVSNVEAITLSEVLSKYVGDDDKPLLLKMDCEGCEYDVVLNDYESVKRFDELIFEYHAYVAKRPVTELLNALSRDFRCEVVRDKEHYKRHGKARHELGLIKCMRRTQHLLK